MSLCISSSKELIRTAPPKAVEENKEGIICKIGHTALGTLYRNRLPSFLLAYPKATHFITPLREHRSARGLASSLVFKRRGDFPGQWLSLFFIAITKFLRCNNL